MIPRSGFTRAVRGSRALTVAEFGREWQEDAACATGHDPRLWYSDIDQSSEKHEPPDEKQRRHTAAAAVCAGCPVRADCRNEFEAQLAAGTNPDGVWAGVIAVRTNRPGLTVHHAGAALDRGRVHRCGTCTHPWHHGVCTAAHLDRHGTWAHCRCPVSAEHPPGRGRRRAAS